MRASAFLAGAIPYGRRTPANDAACLGNCRHQGTLGGGSQPGNPRSGGISCRRETPPASSVFRCSRYRGDGDRTALDSKAQAIRRIVPLGGSRAAIHQALPTRGRRGVVVRSTSDARPGTRPHPGRAGNTVCRRIQVHECRHCAPAGRGILEAERRIAGNRSAGHE